MAGSTPGEGHGSPFALTWGKWWPVLMLVCLQNGRYVWNLTGLEEAAKDPSVTHILGKGTPSTLFLQGLRPLPHWVTVPLSLPLHPTPTLPRPLRA